MRILNLVAIVAACCLYLGPACGITVGPTANAESSLQPGPSKPPRTFAEGPREVQPPSAGEFQAAAEETIESAEGPAEKPQYSATPARRRFTIRSLGTPLRRLMAARNRARRARVIRKLLKATQNKENNENQEIAQALNSLPLDTLLKLTPHKNKLLAYYTKYKSRVSDFNPGDVCEPLETFFKELPDRARKRRVKYSVKRQTITITDVIDNFFFLHNCPHSGPSREEVIE